MGTKNHPGDYDCWAKLEDDEPSFVLMARDPTARRLVDRWATLSMVAGGHPDKIAEARKVAVDMEAWRLDKVRSDEEKAAAMDKVLEADTQRMLDEPPKPVTRETAEGLIPKPSPGGQPVVKSPTGDTPA